MLNIHLCLPYYKQSIDFLQNNHMHFVEIELLLSYLRVFFGPIFGILNLPTSVKFEITSENYFLKDEFQQSIKILLISVQSFARPGFNLNSITHEVYDLVDITCFPQWYLLTRLIVKKKLGNPWKPFGIMSDEQ